MFEFRAEMGRTTRVDLTVHTKGEQYETRMAAAWGAAGQSRDKVLLGRLCALHGLCV